MSIRLDYVHFVDKVVSNLVSKDFKLVLNKLTDIGSTKILQQCDSTQWIIPYVDTDTYPKSYPPYLFFLMDYLKANNLSLPNIKFKLSRAEISIELREKCKRPLVIADKDLGMGNYKIIGFFPDNVSDDPNEKNYFVTFVGGCNGYEQGSNWHNFINIRKGNLVMSSDVPDSDITKLLTLYEALDSLID